MNLNIFLEIYQIWAQSDAALYLTLCEADLEITKVQMKIWSRG